MGESAEAAAGGPVNALERAEEILDHYLDGVGEDGTGVLAAGVLALVSIAESLHEIGRQLERMQRLGIGGRP